TQCEHDKSELSIRPKDRGQKYPSSCAILKKALGETADFHTQQLLQDGNKADQMNFNTPFGKIFNEGVKSNLADPQRRPYMVQYMAQHDTPDTKIQGWMNEYVQMEANLPKILASRHDLGDGISSYDGTIGRHDATAIFKEAYKEGPIVVLTGTTVFIEGKMQVGVSIATNNPNLNVLKIIQNANILASGMPAKANFALENEQAAINAVRAAIALQ
ncbi:MAG: hypothetical protein ACRDFB_05535, partial [Rhabdochlamydiaceae bacterium]